MQLLLGWYLTDLQSIDWLAMNLSVSMLFVAGWAFYLIRGYR